MSCKAENNDFASVQIRSGLLQKLLNEPFSCGEPFNEAQLTREFGVSRQVIREALGQAVGWGIVEYIPRCGFRIRDFSIREIIDWYKLRLAVEPLAGREIAEVRPEPVLRQLRKCCDTEREAFAAGDWQLFAHANREFHRTIVADCGNTQYAKPAVLVCFAVCFNFDCGFRHELMFRNAGTESGEALSETERRALMVRQMTGTMRHDAGTLKILESGKCDQAEKRLRWYVQCVKTSVLRQYAAFGDPEMPFSELVKHYQRYFRKSARKADSHSDTSARIVIPK